MSARCECPEQAEPLMPVSMYRDEELKARVHAPNECPGDFNLRAYLRDGKRIVLCSACDLPGDEVAE